MNQDLEQTSLVKELLQLGTATIGESGGTPLDPHIRPVRPGMKLCGPAYPVVCAPGDNAAIHVSVVDAPPSSVLAVNVGDLPTRGYWGEVLTVAATHRGLAGLVIDGCVRDTDTFEHHGFSVFARGTALRGTSKDRGGSVGSPATIGGCQIAVGDWLIGDADGVVTVAETALGEVLETAHRRQEREARYFEALAAGATTIELLSLDLRNVAR